MRIGEVAQRLGINPKTIRFYESIEVLPEPPRTSSGYRDYGEEHVDRLSFIKSAQRLGLALDDIAEVLRFRDRGERPCDYVVDAIRKELDELDRRMDEMARLRGELEDLIMRADELRAIEGEKYCPLITHATGAAPTV